MVYRRLCLIFLLANLLAGCANHPHRSTNSRENDSTTANDILFRAISLVGTPYRYGGNTPQGGFDCSGLIVYVFQDVRAIDLPHSTVGLNNLPLREVARAQLQSGDLVFFRGSTAKVTHVGIYVGEQRFVHAPNSGGTVRLDHLDGRYWNDHFSHAKRVPLRVQGAGAPLPREPSMK